MCLIAIAICAAQVARDSSDSLPSVSVILVFLSNELRSIPVLMSPRRKIGGDKNKLGGFALISFDSVFIWRFYFLGNLLSWQKMFDFVKAYLDCALFFEKCSQSKHLSEFLANVRQDSKLPR